MTNSNGVDRRQHPRHSPGGLYKVYGGDSREETALATDQGPGGAFLPVRRALPKGTLLILDIHDPEAVYRGPPVLLVAEVMYTKQEPVLGVGIRWKHALCMEGIDRLTKFLESHFNLFLDPKKIGAFHREQLDATIQYDFQFGTLRPVSEDTIDKWRGGGEDLRRPVPPDLPGEGRPHRDSGSGDRPGAHPGRGAQGTDAGDRSRRTGRGLLGATRGRIC